MAITRSVLWLPKLPIDDKDMVKGIAKAIEGLGLHETPLIAGSRKLGEVGPDKKIYLMAHGHEKLAGVTIDKGFWTATEVAKLLIDDGMKADHGVLELLVCWAGASIGDAAYVQENMNVRAQWKAGKAEASALQERFNDMPRPGEFTSASQLIPFAATLMGALKASTKPKFTRLRIISYSMPVDMVLFTGGIHVNVPGGGKLSGSAYLKQWL